MRDVTLVAMISIAALLASCLGALEPEVGDLLEQPCVDEDSRPGVDVSFEHDLLDGVFVDPPGSCLSCHDPGGENSVGYDVGGLDLTSHAGLTAGGVNSAADIAVPGEPCGSVLYEKLGPSPPFGGRMPLSGPPFLDETTAQLVADWIAEGADED
jgi:hypothetical protein